MANITILEDKLVEGKTYQSFAAMCRELALIDNKPIGAGGLGSLEKAIKLQIERYAKINIEQAAKGERKSATILKIINGTPQASASARVIQSNIAEYFRPILYDMINHEHTSNAFVKYHKNLTIDLGYIGHRYENLYKGYYDAIKNSVPFSTYGIKDKRGYAKHAISKFIEKLKGYVRYYCGNERLGYNGVSTYKTLMNIGEFDFMDYSDQQLYSGFKDEIKKEMENKHETVNHMIIPKQASDRFNKYKKKLDSSYKPIELAEMWTFEIESGFKPIPQTVNLFQLNDEILKGYLNQMNYTAMSEYSKTQEYKDIKAASHDDFFSCNPALCSDKDVRQALTVRKRDNKHNREMEIDEKGIWLDFPIAYIDSYLHDIQVIKNACKI